MDTSNRDTHITIIEEVRNLEKISIDSYIENRLIPLMDQDANFLKILYKDIHYLLCDIDELGDNDILIEDGDIVVENGEIKQTGYQTRLHDLMNWLHMTIIEDMANNTPFAIDKSIESFEDNYLSKQTYTPEYRAKLDKIKASIKQERKFNHRGIRPRRGLKFNIDWLELKPNICGMGLNFNEILRKNKQNK